MRLQDDQVKVLRFLVDRKPFPIAFERCRSILKTFQYHGLIDADEELTTRGRHVFSKLPPLPEPEPEPQPELEIELTEETDWD